MHQDHEIQTKYVTNEDRSCNKYNNKTKMVNDVEFLVKDFLDGDKEHLPLRVYTSVVQGFGKEKRLDAAFVVVEHLKRRGGSLNQFMYNCLLSAVKNCGEFGMIHDVLLDMEAKGFSQTRFERLFRGEDCVVGEMVKEQTLNVWSE